MSHAFLFKQLSTIDFYILNRFITSHNNKSLQKLLNTQYKKWSSLTRNCSLPTFTSSETISKPTQYELSQEKYNLLNAGLYFRVLQNLKNIIMKLLLLWVIMKPNKGNGVVILDWKPDHNAIQEIISDTSKFKKLNEDPTLKQEASLQRFLRKLKQKIKMNMINCILLVLLCYGTPKMHNFSFSDTYPKLSLNVSSIGSLNYNLARFSCDLLSSVVPNDYSCKDTFYFVYQINEVFL